MNFATFATLSLLSALRPSGCSPLRKRVARVAHFRVPKVAHSAGLQVAAAASNQKALPQEAGDEELVEDVTVVAERERPMQTCKLPAWEMANPAERKLLSKDGPIRHAATHHRHTKRRSA